MPGGLVKFHTAHKLTLMAHSPKHYTEMGRLVADAGKRDWDELTTEYWTLLMEGLSVMGTRGKHVNVLQHLMGYLKKDLSSEDNAYRWYVGASGPHRGLPAGASAADRAADAAQASPESLPVSRVGAPAGVPTSLPQGADAAEPRVTPGPIDAKSWVLTPPTVPCLFKAVAFFGSMVYYLPKRRAITEGAA